MSPNVQGSQYQPEVKQSQEQLNQQRFKVSDRRFKCYNCNKYGHVANKCFEPQRTPKCLKFQKHHATTTECRTAVNVRKMDEGEKSKPELKKNVVINDWTGEAIVDSGSDRTLMRKTVLENLGAVEKSCVTLNGFGGGQYVSTLSKMVTIVIDETAREVNVLAVEDELLDADVLLGRDVFCQSGTRVVIENEKCWMEGVNIATSDVGQLETCERDKLKRILAEHRDCFAENVQEMGKCTVKKMEIKLSTDVPVNVKPFRIPFAKRAEVREIIEELLCAKIIEHSESPYASPVVLVPKPDGSLRLCVDYRLLNSITVRTPFPMLIIEEQLAQLAGCRYFTTMDLKMGYHQVALHEDSRQYTGFVTVDGHYQYTRMPFGLVNAPAVFQDLMNTLAARLKPGEVLPYLDDVVIPSKTAEEGLGRLTIFERSTASWSNIKT